MGTQIKGVRKLSVEALELGILPEEVDIIIIETISVATTKSTSKTNNP